jgi:hypothetical protein
MKDADHVTLVRYHVFSQAAILTLGTAVLKTFERQRSSGAPYWLPELLVHGHFDFLGGLLVALYRIPTEPQSLWLQLGSSRIEINGSVTSSFSLALTDEEPALADADVLRRFELSVGGAVVAEHEYRLNDREKRLAYSAAPFPAWPDEEENYDLLLHVHRIICSGARSRVLQAPFPV